jgi:hypothetical protein
MKFHSNKTFTSYRHLDKFVDVAWNTFILSHFWFWLPLFMSLVASFPLWWPQFNPRPDHVGFVVYIVAMGQIFSKYFGFPCLFSFQWLLHSHYLLSSGVGRLGQLVANIPSGLKSHPTLLIQYKQNCALTFLFTLYVSVYRPLLLT